MNSIMLDTSFCIRLLKSDDEYHQNAVEYFQFFLENKIIINVSTIVIAEYSVKNDPNHLPLSKMRIVPFDFEDAKIAGEYHNIIKQDKLDLSGLGINRQLIKDDCKILSQITNRQIEGYITKDKKSFSTIIDPILKHSGHKLKLIDLSINLSVYKNELPFPSN
jgi:predicted nucleic acid-binding protein